MKYFLACRCWFLGPWLWGQAVQWELLAPMPEPVSNNAVAAATVEGVPHVFSFAGIDTSRDWHGMHLKGFRYNTLTDVWDTIPPLPDPMSGKVAAAASVVKNRIYFIGGYHVASNYNEVSSAKVHIYDPENNTYIPDGMDIPVSIDDQLRVKYPYDAQLNILNRARQVVLQSPVRGPGQVVDISQHRAGLYFALLYEEEKLVGWEKIYIYR